MPIYRDINVSAIYKCTAVSRVYLCTSDTREAAYTQVRKCVHANHQKKIKIKILRICFKSLCVFSIVPIQFYSQHEVRAIKSKVFFITCKHYQKQNPKFKSKKYLDHKFK